MGYTHELNRIEMRLAFLILQKNHEFSLCHTLKNIILVLKWLCFSGLLDDK